MDTVGDCVDVDSLLFLLLLIMFPFDRNLSRVRGVSTTYVSLERLRNMCMQSTSNRRIAQRCATVSESDCLNPVGLLPLVCGRCSGSVEHVLSPWPLDETDEDENGFLPALARASGLDVKELGSLIFYHARFLRRDEHLRICTDLLKPSSTLHAQHLRLLSVLLQHVFRRGIFVASMSSQEGFLFCRGSINRICALCGPKCASVRLRVFEAHSWMSAAASDTKGHVAFRNARLWSCFE